MTDDTGANDGRDDTTLMSRRNVLIGLGVAGAGVAVTVAALAIVYIRYFPNSVIGTIESTS